MTDGRDSIVRGADVSSQPKLRKAQEQVLVIRRVGTACAAIFVFVFVVHQLSLHYITSKVKEAWELSYHIGHQREDLHRVARNTQSIMLLRNSSFLDESLTHLNEAKIRSLSQRILGREDDIEQVIDQLAGPIISAEEMFPSRAIYLEAVKGFLTRAESLGSSGRIDDTWAMPDLAVAPYGTIMSNLSDWESTTKKQAEFWSTVDEVFSSLAVLVLAITSITFILFFFRPLANRAISNLKVLEQSMLVRTRYFYQMSHELRTPLNVIGGYSQLLKAVLDPKDGKDIGSYTDAIESGVSSLTHLIDDIFLITELQAGSYENRKTQVCLVETIEDTIGRCQMGTVLTSMRDHAVADQKSVECDRVALDKILEHLVRNAQQNAKTFCKIVITKEDGPLEVRIIDDGPGLNIDDIERLFDPFHTVKNDAFTTESGLGIGLSIVRELAEINHIGIELMSTNTLGTTIRLDFSSCLWAEAHNDNSTGSDMEKMPNHNGG